MKLFVLIAAGLMGVATMTPAAASAAPAPAAVTLSTAGVVGVDSRVVVRERRMVRHIERRRGGWGTRRVCTNKWRHHRKVRVCRKVRYRR